MKRKCIHCFRMFGEKEPFHDEAITHGTCPECAQIEREKVRKLLDDSLKVLKDAGCECVRASPSFSDSGEHLRCRVCEVRGKFGTDIAC